MDDLNDILAARGVSHAIYLERLKTHEVREIMALLARTDARIRHLLAEGAFEAHDIRHARRVAASLVAIEREGWGVVRDRLQAGLLDLAEYEVEFQARTIQRSAPIRLSLTQPSPGQVMAAVRSRPFGRGAILEHTLDRVATDRREMIEGAIQQGFVEGASVQQMTARLYGTARAGYRDGMMETTRRAAQAVIRTAHGHTANVARETLYADNADIIKAVQWVSTLDHRTCVVCMETDGKTFAPNDGPRPPAHYNCRCTTVPVVRSWRELGIDLPEPAPGVRAAMPTVTMTGQPAATMTYPAWLRQQPRDVVEDALGRDRAALFLDHGVPIDRFVDDGRSMTLSEIRQREGID